MNHKQFTKEDLEDDAVQQYLHDRARNEEVELFDDLLDQLQSKLDGNPPRHAVFLEQLKNILRK